ncbi:MAG: hypothetical protein JO356_18265 [Acidobacteria bacterium]|nr:hypothetical protein [Acidobacteriota bacterium]
MAVREQLIIANGIPQVGDNSVADVKGIDYRTPELFNNSGQVHLAPSPLR